MVQESAMDPVCIQLRHTRLNRRFHLPWNAVAFENAVYISTPILCQNRPRGAVAYPVIKPLRVLRFQFHPLQRNDEWKRRIIVVPVEVLQTESAGQAADYNRFAYAGVARD